MHPSASCSVPLFSFRSSIYIIFNNSDVDEDKVSVAAIARLTGGSVAAE